MGSVSTRDVPAQNFCHPAYRTLRRIAWMYRAERNGEQSEQLAVAMRAVADYLKKNSGALPEHVEQVAKCLTMERCGCSLCRCHFAAI